MLPSRSLPSKWARAVLESRETRPFPKMLFKQRPDPSDWRIADHLPGCDTRAEYRHTTAA
jgi:hypothetical protein